MEKFNKKKKNTSLSDIRRNNGNFMTIIQEGSFLEVILIILNLPLVKIGIHFFFYQFYKI